MSTFSSKDESYIKDLSRELSRQVSEEIFKKKTAGAAEVLKLVGAGAFLAASIAIPNLPRALKPLLNNDNEREAWKRFNIKYLKRTLQRLESQKMVRISTVGGKQIVELTDNGRKKVLRYALDTMEIKSPQGWNGLWTMVSYDVPSSYKTARDVFREYLEAWGFYPLHESMFLHAYSCDKEVEFIREYLGIGRYVRIFKVAKIENDKPFRDFFGI